MVKYNLPFGMRYSSLVERENFYNEEFNLKKISEWIRKRTHFNGLVFAAVIGRHTKISPLRYSEDASTTIIIDEYENLEDVRRYLLDFKPESVYYDRNIYDDDHEIVGQELAFDLDPENIDCPIHGTLENKMAKGQGLSFCELELKMVKEETVKLYDELLSTFSDLEVVYSGRGFHIHVFDDDVMRWTYKRRSHFANKIRNQGFMIDKWVTTGSMRLIRLPYSLHGMVSRIVTPLKISELEDFDPLKDKMSIPKFLELKRSNL
ncbi:MAG: DNA primase, partial [Candidatus Bathyarchaeota archaeon]